ncbi:MAG: DNRLRE domain-containing protein, partial [Planctomycetota bacterium]
PGFTENNFGAHSHVPVGRTNSDRVNRAVFDFDIASFVPSGAVVTDAVFQFEVTLQGGPQGMGADNFSLHRLTKAWDEGTGQGNIGEMTMDGFTWSMATSAVAWDTLGGDFDATTSGFVNVNGPNTYQLTSAKLISDIQNIVDGTESNFGWLLKAETEEVMGSAARVTSREANGPAQLIITVAADEVLLADVNLDGAVNLLDVDPFIDRLSTSTFQAEADCNEDGTVDLLDVDPFVSILSGA